MRRAEPFAGAIERQQQRELQRVAQVIDELDDRLVQLHPERDQRTQQGRRAENREHRDHRAERGGQRDLFRRDALPKLIEDRRDDLALPEAGGFRWGTVCDAWFHVAKA